MVRSVFARLWFLTASTVCLNVSGLSRASCGCSQAMMRSARFVPKYFRRARGPVSPKGLRSADRLSRHHSPNLANSTRIVSGSANAARLVERPWPIHNDPCDARDLGGEHRRRASVDKVRAELRISERRACAALGQHRSTQRKPANGRDDEAALTADIVELAKAYDYCPSHVRARRRFRYMHRAEVKVRAKSRSFCQRCLLKLRG
jgi:hypothetical protein